MFNLIRRISYGVIPRADRPWEEDPTSNAPNTKRKRRLSTSEHDMVDDEDQVNKKKARGDSSTPSVVDAEGLVPVPQADTAEVKDVTQGVDHVHLDGNEEKDASADGPAPESVPLPDEAADELEDSSADAPFSPAGGAAAEDESVVDAAAEDTTTVVDDASDVASSSAEDTVPEPTQIIKPKEPAPGVQSTEISHAAPELEAQA